MTPREKATAQKTARIIRAGRKKSNLTQTEVASRLGVTQSCLSKIESGVLIPSISQWYDFCKLTGVPSHSFETGTIDQKSKITLLQGNREGTFILPKQFSENRGQSVRSLLPFLNFLYSQFGETKGRNYLKSIKVDPDFFVILDNQLNIEIALEMTRYFIRQGKLKPAQVKELTRPVSEPSSHGELHLGYDRIQEPLSLVSALIHRSPFYQCDFEYKIEEETSRKLSVSIHPEKHLELNHIRNDSDLGHFLCHYHKEYLTQFSKYSGNKGLHFHEKSCFYKGDASCLYEAQAS